MISSFRKQLPTLLHYGLLIEYQYSVAGSYTCPSFFCCGLWRSRLQRQDQDTNRNSQGSLLASYGY